MKVFHYAPLTDSRKIILVYKDREKSKSIGIIRVCGNLDNPNNFIVGKGSNSKNFRSCNLE